MQAAIQTVKPYAHIQELTAELEAKEQDQGSYVVVQARSPQASETLRSPRAGAGAVPCSPPLQLLPAPLPSQPAASARSLSFDRDSQHVREAPNGRQVRLRDTQPDAASTSIAAKAGSEAAAAAAAASAHAAGYLGAARGHGQGLPSDCLNFGYFDKFFQSVRRIGTGAYGSVYECRHVMDGFVLGSYAVKVCAVGDRRHWLRKVR